MRATFILALVGASVSYPVWGRHWTDLTFAINAGNLPITNPPTLAVYRDNAGGTSDGVLAAQFHDNAEAQEDQYWFEPQMPHGWVQGSDTHIHAHVAPEDGTTCNYRLCVEYIWGDEDTAFPANTTEDCVTFASSENSGLSSLEEISIMDMTNMEMSAIGLMRLYRNSSHGEDTCNGLYLWIFTADIHFELDRLGSMLEDIL